MLARLRPHRICIKLCIRNTLGRGSAAIATSPAAGWARSRRRIMRRLSLSQLVVVLVLMLVAAAPQQASGPAPAQSSTAAAAAAQPTRIPLDLFQVPPGFEVTLWAATPMLHNPTNIDIDREGRIWVAEGVRYR